MPIRPIVRPYRPEDHDAVYDICVRTADGGGDSREIYPDPDLMPSIFAAPYIELEPELAFVVDDAGSTVGYIIGTADTGAFVERFRKEWLPTLVDRYPPLTAEPATPSEAMIGLMHTPERMVQPELAHYPAHLHIDLLPGYQRSGLGRELMHTFLGALHDRGIAKVHLTMVTTNTAARAFYDRMGFFALPVPNPGPVTYLGRGTEVER
jgi:ribosomal protein S18 acetylase RimI-like enzyme